MTQSTEKQNFKKIPIVDLSCRYKRIQDEIKKVAIEVLSSGSYVMGENVRLFESELAKYLNCNSVIACANGTDAITLSLMALDIKPGDEIITVSHSFFATSEAIALVGAKPVFVDIREEDFNIDPTKIEKLITKKTKAIIPVHLYGQPCEISSIIEIARKHNLYVIEDCAQAMGAEFNEKKVGTFGDIGTISFFPTKNLGAFGDGGAICTNNETIAKKLKSLRVHGSSERYVHNYIGLNSRLDELQAAMLRIELKYLDRWNKERQEAAKYYDKLFVGINDLFLPKVKPFANHIFHQYTVRLKNRDLIYEKLRNLGVEALIYYPIPIHLQKAFDYLGYEKNSLPVTEKLCNEILSLPMYPELKKEDQEYIAETIKNIFKK